MVRPLRFGAMFSPADPVADLAVFADQVDGLGFDELWLAEDCFAYGAMSTATVALTSMDRAAVGIGLLPAGLRNPALAAMELSTIAHLFPGRLRVAFGHGVEAWMRQIGARPRDRVAYLREVADATARLSRGEEVSRDGQVVLDRVKLDQAPESPPEFLLGTTGPRGLELANELGCGLLLPEGAGAAAIRRAGRALRADCSLTVYCWLSLADEDDQADAALLPVVRKWRASELYPQLYQLAGLPPGTDITRDKLGAIAVAGTPERCARQIAVLHQAGADTIVFLPIGGDRIESLERMQSEVVPLLG